MPRSICPPGRGAQRARRGFRSASAAATCEPRKRTARPAPRRCPWFVQTRGRNPAGGAVPLHRRLRAMLEAETVADAFDVAVHYARRCTIEEPCQSMKREGFDTESPPIRAAEPRNRLVLACYFAAPVVMQMTAKREEPLLRPPDNCSRSGGQGPARGPQPRSRRRDGTTEDPGSPSQPRLRKTGARAPRRPDRIPRQARAHCAPRRMDRSPNPENGADLGRAMCRCAEKDVRHR